MFKVLLLPVIGIVLVLQFRCIKETKNYRINELNESFYRNSEGTNKEYINKQIINKYEH